MELAEVPRPTRWELGPCGAECQWLKLVGAVVGSSAVKNPVTAVVPALPLWEYVRTQQTLSFST